MIVNPFWFGCLVTLVVEIILLCIGAYVHLLNVEKEERNYRGKEGTDKKRN